MDLETLGTINIAALENACSFRIKESDHELNTGNTNRSNKDKPIRSTGYVLMIWKEESVKAHEQKTKNLIFGNERIEVGTK